MMQYDEVQLCILLHFVGKPVAQWRCVEHLAEYCSLCAVLCTQEDQEKESADRKKENKEYQTLCRRSMIDYDTLIRE